MSVAKFLESYSQGHMIRRSNPGAIFLQSYSQGHVIP